ncbi:MAG: cation-translocating P-type ATPase [Candidatus Buchananbacteria bacterium]|nr:cation-translocating P-type ATPase [Candidatus Buchananbacteria bacterium]
MENNGLTTKEANIKLSKFGPNEIKRFEKINPLKIFLEQFTSPFIIVLIVAALISWGVGFFPGQDSDIVDVVLILIIVFISGIAGFIQEYRSEQTVEALIKMASPKAKVVRDGTVQELSASQLVPGDLILIESGDVIPADAKLIEVYNLEINEASLTGESLAVNQKVGAEIYMNTFVNSGSAKAIIDKTGMQTKMGQVAEKLQTIQEEPSTFSQEMSRFSKSISLWITILIVIMAAVNLFKYDIATGILLAISLAVAAIPEGLPAVLTLTLSLNAKLMAQKNALVRKLSVIESVGAVDVICTDKTGTLTKNEMAVKKLYINHQTIDVETIDNHKISDELSLLFTISALCNNSLISGSNGQQKYLGDETEIALRKIAKHFGLVKERLEEYYKKVGEVSFTSIRKMMSVFYQHGKHSTLHIFTKGAPEILIEKCNRLYLDGKVVVLDAAEKAKILKQNEQFAQSGLRVLGFAYRQEKQLKKPDFSKLENDLIWLGLQAMYDPPRSEVKAAIQEAHEAGVRVIMITGDNALTAQAIGREIGLESPSVIIGSQLDKMSDEQLAENLEAGVNIFARTTPLHKFKILEVLKNKYRVAMTGDGVNDSLAIKKADVGFAMGIKGTEVTKQASDIILLDDNFASITHAIKEGRKTFDNIRKFVNYLLTCNLAEILVIFIATVFINLSGPVLLPVQILWVNLLTDGLPALALGVDPARPDVMKEKPRGKGELILGRRLRWLIGVIGIKKTIILLATFLVTLPLGLDVARSTLLTGFVLYEFVRIASIRSQEKLTWLSNKWLLVALAGSTLAQLFILYTPLNKFFGLVPIGIIPWMILGVGILIGYFGAIWFTRIIVKYVPD